MAAAPRQVILATILLLGGAAPGGAEEPALPSGLGGSVPPPEPQEPAALSSTLRLSGFVEGRGGLRLDNGADEPDASLAESRLRLEADQSLPFAALRVAADILYNGIADSHAIDLKTGAGAVDLREAHARFSPASFLDVKAGRQILTWGTGDLLFINDLFPKDWNSFLLGRDEQYLKAPSDAVKLSAFSDWANLDVVYTPRFDADRFVDGQWVSFFNPAVGRVTGRDAIIDDRRPDQWFRDDEWALRLHRGFGAYEGALYVYDGFWKSPAGYDPSTGESTYPALTVFGASLRGPLASGIISGEIGYYRSRQDLGGSDPNVRNSEIRALVGYEQEIAQNLTLGVQYYLERMLDHAAYRRSLSAGSAASDENRHVLTQRLTWLTMNQDLEWSLFIFFSPSDMDAYVRPRVKYKYDDHITFEFGGNFFVGERNDTFFGQFEYDTNIYLAVRYGF